MPDQKHSTNTSLPSQKLQHKEHVEGACRPTFYMNADLLAALEAQCAIEGGKKRSPFLVELLNFLLTSPTGQQLRDQAKVHQRTLVYELERNLILFNEHIPTERIKELAEKSQRHPDQMLVRLVLIGLKIYERSITCMETEIETSKETL